VIETHLVLSSIKIEKTFVFLVSCCILVVLENLHALLGVIRTHTVCKTTKRITGWKTYPCGACARSW